MEPLSFFMGMLACALALAGVNLLCDHSDRRARVAAARRRAAWMRGERVMRQHLGVSVGG